MSRLFKALVLFSTGSSVACGGDAGPSGSGGSGGGASGGTGGGDPGVETGGSGSSDTASGGSGGSIFECTPAELECADGEMACAATDDGEPKLVGVDGCDCGDDVPTEPDDCEAGERLVCGARSIDGYPHDNLEPAACRCVTATGTDAGDCEAYQPGREMGVATDQEPGAEPLLCGCAYIVLR